MCLHKVGNAELKGARGSDHLAAIAIEIERRGGGVAGVDSEGRACKIKNLFAVQRPGLGVVDQIDRDLDIAASTSWSASKSGTTLTVTVSSSVTGYSAGNSLGAGYTITSYGTYLDSGTTRTFTYACSY